MESWVAALLNEECDTRVGRGDFLWNTLSGTMAKGVALEETETTIKENYSYCNLGAMSLVA